MSIQSIVGAGAASYGASAYRASAPQPPAAAAAAAVPASVQSALVSAGDPVKEFLDYMKETPAQRLEDSWLASHHITREQYEAMPPEQRQALQKQMASELKEQMKQAALDKPHKKGGILV